MKPFITIVLVKTIYPSNIGSAARAAANMGAQRLVLVNPQCEINSKAKQGAAGAQSMLQSHETYKSWDEFYATEGNGIRFAFTRRGGKNRQVDSFKKRLASLQQEDSENFNQPLYFIFGPEDNGLAAEDIELAHYACSLPTYGSFASMNLSQAVLLSLFSFHDFIGTKENEIDNQEFTEGFKQPTYYPEESLKNWLEAIGFDLSARRKSAYTTLRRLLLKNRPHEKDLMVLEAILQQTIRKLKDKSF